MSAVIVALAAFCYWVSRNTIPVVVVDQSGNPIGNVAVRPVVVPGMRGATDGRRGKAVIFGDATFELLGYAPSAPRSNSASWRRIARKWADRFTFPHGIVLTWESERTVYASSGGIRLPDSPHLLAVSIGDLKAGPEDVFTVEPCFGRAGGGPGRIVIRPADPSPSWLDTRRTWDLKQPTIDKLCQMIEATVGG